MSPATQPKKAKGPAEEAPAEEAPADEEQLDEQGNIVTFLSKWLHCGTCLFAHIITAHTAGVPQIFMLHAALLSCFLCVIVPAMLLSWLYLPSTDKAAESVVAHNFTGDKTEPQLWKGQGESSSTGWKGDIHNRKREG